ncbi:hypothetical protein V497_08321, partial [Pseudogymnoascus sp. VKM F-4516 (FW-969)]
PACPIVRP